MSEDDGAIRRMRLEELRELWRDRFKEMAPSFRSRDLLARALIYRLEAAREGAMKAPLRRKLRELAECFASDRGFNPESRIAPSIGSALVREWNGARHIALVTPQGYQYGDTTYASLTKVAKAISGTHQSGPRFFGLVGPSALEPGGGP